MDYEELQEVETILEELSEYEYRQIKPRVSRLKKLLESTLESERRKHYRSDNNLKSSVDRDIVKEVAQAQSLLNGIKTMHNRAYNEVGYHDKATNDLLHALELLEGDEEELVEYTKELRNTRQMRRQAKDFQTKVNPLISFIHKNSKAIKDFNEVVEEMKANEEKMKERVYTPRVKTEMELAFEEAMAVEKEDDK